MKTGYFNQLRNARIDGAVCIAVGKPKYVTVNHIFKPLAPSWKLLNSFRADMIDEAEYVVRFNEQLSKLDAYEVINYLEEMTGGEEPVLMCHCGIQHFCHRHLVAEWLERETGIQIEEQGIGHVVRENGRILEQQPTLEI